MALKAMVDAMTGRCAPARENIATTSSVPARRVRAFALSSISDTL
jgi:hypothetical protein